MDRTSFLYKRVVDNPIEPRLVRLVDYLIDRRYSASACLSLVSASCHFGRWLGDRPLSNHAAEQYLKVHLPNCQCEGSAPRNPQWNGKAVRHLLALEGIAPEKMKGLAAEILERYRGYLIRERGLKANSVRYSLRQAIRTLTDLKAQDKADLQRWSPRRVECHAIRETCGHAGTTNHVTMARMRIFVRFLHRERLIAEDLSRAIPKVPYWRGSTLPPGVDQETVRQLLSAAKADRTAQGLRNLAILMCLSELGIRASDLMALELDGLDWMSRTLRLRDVKGRREMTLPMSRGLAGALKAYVTKGRPKCITPWVFVHDRAPVGRQLTSAGVRNILTRLSVAANLPALIQSTHAFRRSIAGRMLQCGASLKQIADVLGHRSINTTARYTYSDMNALTDVAMPWPVKCEVYP